ncbi:hypothetical protein [Thioalkalivibrio paradoxus]|uniref:J domain-containing protein n=1 Tax=Thioalkalivibrio paradoxus ARh 1 TaxID=713585 RepID=W0DN10_9GAMM|nr:hypothetical protein [Thioalkalivibrio paradoxus]AHE99979.1 hypothetical protein THITH_05540 [Thioalkalivibrio paradoxus ARh 1]
MPASDDNLQALASRLRQGMAWRLDDRELDAVLAWIAAGDAGFAAPLAEYLGPSQTDPELLRRIFEQLDRQIFRDGALQEEAAGVGQRLTVEARRVRYRRLMAAFHPDRHPELVQWVTPRSQAIHQAYARFRRNAAAGEPAPPQTQAMRPRHGAPAPVARRRWRRIHFGPGLLVLLRGQLAQVRNLQAKILTLVAIMAFLPVLHIYLTQGPARGAQSESGHDLVAAPEPQALEHASAGHDGTAGIDRWSGEDHPGADDRLASAAGGREAHGRVDSGPPGPLERTQPAPASQPQENAGGDDDPVLTGVQTIEASPVEEPPVIELAPDRSLEPLAGTRAIPGVALSRPLSSLSMSQRSESGDPTTHFSGFAPASTKWSAASPGAGAVRISNPPDPTSEQAPPVPEPLVAWVPPVYPEAGAPARADAGSAVPPDDGRPSAASAPAATVRGDTPEAGADSPAAVSPPDSAAAVADRDISGASTEAALEDLEAASDRSRPARDATGSTVRPDTSAALGIEARERRVPDSRGTTRTPEPSEPSVPAPQQPDRPEQSEPPAPAPQQPDRPEQSKPPAPAPQQPDRPEQSKPPAAAPQQPDRPEHRMDPPSEAASASEAGARSPVSPPARDGARPPVSANVHQQSPSAAEPPAPSRTVTAAPAVNAEQQIRSLIEGYRRAFERGDLHAFLQHLTLSPTENANRGRNWFQQRYLQLFQRSQARVLRVEIASIQPEADGWLVEARFELEVDYPDQPRVRASGPIRYRILNQFEEWRIDSIQY